MASVGGRIPIRFALFDPEADEDPSGPSGRPGARPAPASAPGLLALRWNGAGSGRGFFADDVEIVLRP